MSRCSKLLLLTLSCFHVFSAAQAEADSTRGRWSLGLAIGAGMGYRTLSATSSSATSDAIIKSRDDREEPALAFGTRAVMGYRLSKHWGVEAGVGYSRLGWKQRVDLSALSFGDQIDPRRGFIYATNDIAFKSITFIDVFHYLEFPIGVTFQCGNGKWSLISSTGVAPTMLIAEEVRTVKRYESGKPERQSESSQYDFNIFNLFPYISTGVALRASERWELRLQPTVRYGVLRIIDAPITGHLFMGSVDLGVRLTL